MSVEQDQRYAQKRFTAPRGATEILLVRHGASRAATPGAPFPLIDGQGDPELAPEGVEQAQKVAERLAGQPISAIYVTNMRRTAQTAQPLAARLGLEPRVEPDLREVHLGEWEGGVYRIRAHARDPIYLRKEEEQRWDVIPGAESNEQLNVRCVAAIERIHRAHPSQLVVSVCHGGVVACLLAHASGSRPFAFAGADNCSISHLVVHDSNIVVRCFNDTSHLYPSFSVTAELPT
ncbi:MAG: histidine phosphatase family protein [Gammaproteobacteria bacterium]|nr:histidine phosphatase family protein [Gammaproteobacteria bacterium]